MLIPHRVRNDKIQAELTNALSEKSCSCQKTLFIRNQTTQAPNTEMQNGSTNLLWKELTPVLPSADQSSAGEKDAAHLLCLLEQWLAWTSEAKWTPWEPERSPGEQSNLCTHALSFQSVWPSPVTSRIPPGPVQMATLKQRCCTFWPSNEQPILSCWAVSHSWCLGIASANTARNPRNQIFALILWITPALQTASFHLGRTGNQLDREFEKTF